MRFKEMEQNLGSTYQQRATLLATGPMSIAHKWAHNPGGILILKEINATGTFPGVTVAERSCPKGMTHPLNVTEWQTGV